MTHAIRLAGILLIGLVAFSDVVAQDPGWPRKNVQTGGTLISYQPQVDDWKGVARVAVDAVGPEAILGAGSNNA